MIIKFSRAYQRNATECLIDKCVPSMSGDKFRFNLPACSFVLSNGLNENSNSNIYTAFKFTLFTGDFRADCTLSLLARDFRPKGI